MSAVDTARDALIAVITPLRNDLDETKVRITEIENELQPLEEALKRLDPPKKPKSKAPRKASKPSARKEDVIAVCLKIVKENQPIAKTELESLAKYKLGEEMGFDLKGFSLRFTECLRTDGFEISDGKVQIPKEQVQ